MSLLDYLKSIRKNNNSAQLAKERLQIIIAHERNPKFGQDFLPKLQKELVDVIAKYVDIDAEQVKVDLIRQGSQSILELNVTLPQVAA